MAMDAHDPSYKLLFSHTRMVRDLLTGFVPAHLIAGLDLDRMEKVNASYTSDDLRGRHGDAVWRVPRTDRRADVYVLLEFQSSVDRHMALRTLVYTGLLHQDL